MEISQSPSESLRKPLWLLAELTYRCPLKCSYCSNPKDFKSTFGKELSTADWKEVLSQGRQLGAVQLGFSGGEPLLRRDLEELVQHARELGYYTNLITSGVGLTASRLDALKRAGLDHIQLSFQSSQAELNDVIAGQKCFEEKKVVMQRVKASGFPVVFNVVLHRKNMDQLEEMVEFAYSQGANYIELACVQFAGWALVHRESLMPSQEQVLKASEVTQRLQQKFQGLLKIYFVVPDYFEGKAKPCAAGWGRILITVAPDGLVLPCHGARDLPFDSFPSVAKESLKAIWESSAIFNRFRGTQWMRSPCQGCPGAEVDFGGCRCQAYALTGKMEAADPACSLSPDHQQVLKWRNSQQKEPSWPVYRGMSPDSVTLS
jgi:pyrroloquinoline quinone biosynthesis protein E